MIRKSKLNNTPASWMIHDHLGNACFIVEPFMGMDGDGEPYSCWQILDMTTSEDLVSRTIYVYTEEDAEIASELLNKIIKRTTKMKFEDLRDYLGL